MTTATRPRQPSKKRRYTYTHNGQDSSHTRKKPEEMVADRILELLDKGDLPPWTKPWKYSLLGSAHNAISRKPYRGINIWLLSIASALENYQDPRWLTYKQAQQLGGHVRKGEKATWIVFWKLLTPKPKDPETDTIQIFDQQEESQTRERKFPMARLYKVFNAAQTEDCKLPTLEEDANILHDPIAEAEDIIAGMPYPPEFETYSFENQPPHYIPILDKVRVPDKSRYDNLNLYYNSAFHELIHSTGHEKRLSRFNSKEIGRENLHQYAAEELVAGMGAAMLTAKSRIDLTTIEVDAASYIKYWAGKIQADKSIVMNAAQRAQRAVDYICPPTPGHEQDQSSSAFPIETEVETEVETELIEIT